MKNFFRLLPILFYLNATSQIPEIQFPSYGFTLQSYPAYNAILSDTITNRGTTPSEFYFNYIQLDSFKNIVNSKKKMFYSDDSFLVWVYSHRMSTDPDERRLEYIRALATFFKNDIHFRNYLNIASGWNGINQDSSFMKLESINGSNCSHRNQQCGDFAIHAMRALNSMYEKGLDTIATSPDYYRSIALDGHAIFESYFHGSWAFVDVDPGTEGFMFMNSKGGYYSTQELVDSPSRVSANWIKKVDEEGRPYLNAWYATEEIYSLDYRSYFQTTGPPKNETKFRDKLKTFPAKPQEVSGKIILPPGASLVFHYQNDAAIFNMNDTVLVLNIDSLMNLITEWKNGQIDSTIIINFFSSITNIPENEVPSIFARDAFGSFTKRWRPHWEKDGVLPPIVEYIIPNMQNLLNIGKDIGGPFTVVDVKCSKPIIIDGEKIPYNFHFDLWDEKGTGGPTNWDYKQYHYLTEGHIEPNTTATIKCAYNPGWIQWWNGYSIDQLGRLDTLELRRSSNVALVNNIINSVQSITKNKIDFYPNPTTGSLIINGISSEAKVFVYDIQGRTISIEKSFDKEKLYINIKTKGLFFVTIEDKEVRTTKKIIVQ